MARIVIKVGSNVLTRSDGTLDVTRMSSIVDQIATLHKQGVQIILVSMGYGKRRKRIIGFLLLFYFLLLQYGQFTVSWLSVVAFTFSLIFIGT